MSILSGCSSSLLRLIVAHGASPASLVQQIVSGAARSFSSSAAASSSGTSWTYNCHLSPRSVPDHHLDIPQHDIEDGLPEVDVWLRPDSGTNYCSKLRRVGGTPCQLSSLPGNKSIPLTLSSGAAAKLVRQFGRNGLQAQVLALNIYQQQPQKDTAPSAAADSSSTTSTTSSSSSGGGGGGGSPSGQQEVDDAGPSSSSSSSSSSSASLLARVRVLPKCVYMHSVTQEVENFNFLFCPPERLVKVNVPVKLWNSDVSPGVRGGGWLHVVNRTVPVLARGWAVKPYFELDMRHMKAKDVLRFSDVAMPEGCLLHAKDPSQPVVRCAARVGGE